MYYPGSGVSRIGRYFEKTINKNGKKKHFSKDRNPVALFQPLQGNVIETIIMLLYDSGIIYTNEGFCDDVNGTTTIGFFC